VAIEILDKGACKAMGVLDTSASVVSAATAGIRRVISSGVNGRVRLVLDEGIGQTELVAHVTPLPPVIGAGVIPAVAWIDDFTIEIQTYDTAGLLAAAQVRFSFFKIQALASPAIDPALPNPLQILGNNLAFWVQGDLGLDEVEPGNPVATWPNQVANGDAVQAPFVTAPTLQPNAFGSRPGVRFGLATDGLLASLTTPSAIGQRPYFWVRFRLDQLIHTPGAQQSIVTGFSAGLPPGATEIFLDADASGTFGPTAFWDSDWGTDATSQDTFLNPAELDLLPHTQQSASQQVAQLVFDGVAVNAAGAIPALATALDRIALGNLPSPPFAPGNDGLFGSLGVVVMSFDQPSPAEIAAVAAWCNAYS
jgi:hypothetical protein